jgi:hypothetical protein
MQGVPLHALNIGEKVNFHNLAPLLSAKLGAQGHKAPAPLTVGKKGINPTKLFFASLIFVEGRYKTATSTLGTK